MKRQTKRSKKVNLEKEFDIYCKDLHAIDIQEEPFSQMYACADYFFELGVKVTQKEMQRLKAKYEKMFKIKPIGIKTESSQRLVLPDLSSMFHQEMERRIEYILRNLISSPIHGEITKQKLQARGIKLVHVNLDNFNVPKITSTERMINISQNVYITEKGGKKYYLSDVKL